MAARPALIRDLVCYLRSRASPWSAYFHFKNLCAQRLTTGGHYLVLRGPFAGMAIGRQGSGMQLPMLVGSYEMEIWPFLDSMERAGIRRSIHLGAANGYFAVGFAWKFHHEVTAFESRQDDRDTMLATARQNQVSDRVHIRPACRWEDLRQEIERPNSMIFCDIDGAEEELLDPQRIPGLRGIPILVETHPLNHGEGHSRDLLKERFGPSHLIQEEEMKPRFPHLMQAFSDHPGAFRLKGLENEILAAALEERRGKNTWLWMVPQTASHPA